MTSFNCYVVWRFGYIAICASWTVTISKIKVKINYYSFTELNENIVINNNELEKMKKFESGAQKRQKKRLFEKAAQSQR